MTLDNLFLITLYDLRIFAINSIIEYKSNSTVFLIRIKRNYMNPIVLNNVQIIQLFIWTIKFNVIYYISKLSLIDKYS